MFKSVRRIMVGGFMLIQSDFPVPPFPWMVGKKKKKSSIATPAHF
jgi:hypothetical protein